jgi:Organic solute transport protein 1
MEYSLSFILPVFGCEMGYVLHQRMHAQKMSKSKIRVCLKGLLDQCTDSSISFEPQDVLTLSDIKNLCNKLLVKANIKLNSTGDKPGPSSFDKLFDLAAMSIKYQIMRTACPEDLYQIVANHIDQVAGFSQVDEGVRRFITKLKALYSKFNKFQFSQLKMTLLNLLIGYKTKIAALIEKQYQDDSTGDITINPEPICAPGVTKLPGTVVYTSQDGTEKEVTHKMASIQKLFDQSVMPGNFKRFAENIIYTDLGLSVFSQPSEHSTPAGLFERVKPTRNNSSAPAAATAPPRTIDTSKDLAALSLLLDTAPVTSEAERSKVVDFVEDDFEVEEDQSPVIRHLVGDIFKDLPKPVRKEAKSITGDNLLDMMDNLDNY